ncbi:MAG: response regulator [Vicinamibacterales bacterium]
MTRRFGAFVLEPDEFRLTRDGVPVPLSPRPFDLLVALTARPGRLVTRDELLAEVWKDTAVEASSLNAAMSLLRQALGDDARIETVPGRGYRFQTPVTEEAPRRAPRPDAEAGTTRRVVIVDDHAIVRMGIRALLARLPGYDIVGEAATVDEAGSLIARTAPDLVVLDLMLGDETSLPAIGAWRTGAPDLRIIVLSMHDEDERAREALAAGADGYVMKGGMLEELAEAVDTVMAGGVWVSARLGRAILRDVLDGRPLSAGAIGERDDKGRAPIG